MNFPVLNKDHSHNGKSAELPAAAMPVGNSRPAPFRETRAGWLTLGVIWSVCAIFMLQHLRVGSFPADFGELGEMAERVLGGQVPYRDFMGVYTGGLSYLNALAFRLFGVADLSLRIPVFFFFLGWVPAVYFIARRFAGPLSAGVVTLLAVAWGPPSYPEAMPSLYNLFLATWGVWALFRYIETERRRWLWVAGFCAGVSFLVKITALYFVAAALLFFVFREVQISRSTAPPKAREGTLYKAFATGGLLTFAALLIRLTAQRPNVPVFFNFALPSCCLVAFLVWIVWVTPCDRLASRIRLKRLIGMGIPFLAAAAVPIGFLSLWFASQGALNDWVRGTFITSIEFVQWGARNPLSPWASIGLGPLIILFAEPLLRKGKAGRLWRGVLIAGLAAGLLAAYRSPAVYALFGVSAVLVFPWIGIGAPFFFAGPQRIREPRVQEAWLVVATAVVCAMIAFPRSDIGYPTSEILPLGVLALLALISLKARPGGFAQGSLAAFYLGFALLLGTPTLMIAEAYPLRARPVGGVRLVPVSAGPLAGMRYRPSEAQTYEKLMSLIRAHAHGPYIYAGPDSPDVYFISGLRNPTATIWDFRDPDFTDPVGRARRVLSELELHDVCLVAIQKDPVISGTMPAALKEALNSRFPNSQTVGSFDVRWR